MAIGEICSRQVVFARRDESVAAAAKLMREGHVGCLVVTDEDKGKRVPVGMLTDRDITVAVVAPGLDAETMLNETRARALNARFDLDRSVRTLNFSIGLAPVPEV